MIYQTPSINGLVDAILAAIQHRETEEDGVQSKVNEMLRKVEEYSAEFPVRTPSADLAGALEGEVVLVTGTTSGLGCDILAHLLADQSVARVYALNRRLPHVEKRQRASFRERGLDEALLSSPKYRAVEGDTSVPGFAIEPLQFEEVRDAP